MVIGGDQMNDSSILSSVKKMLGLDDTYTEFDTDLIIHINTALAVLAQLGVGPDEGFAIDSKIQTWDEFVDNARLNNVKTYVYMKVKLIFDPPQNSSAKDAMEKMISEMEWRLTVQAENEKTSFDAESEADEDPEAVT